jgi:bisanhydrobacterioruberin hydratase
MKNARLLVCFILIILFHIVGFVGFTSPALSSDFEKLVPVHLLLMLVLLIVAQRDRGQDFWLFLSGTWLAGFTVELIGVHTGFPFGNYSYGGTLGIKLADIPLMIGVNWILVIFSCGAFVKELGIRNHVLRALTGGLLVTILDFLIEPIAIRFDYWTWTDMAVPFKNYAAWFVVSAILLLFYYKLRFRKYNSAAATLFVVQLLFFLALNLTVL